MADFKISSKGPQMDGDVVKRSEQHDQSSAQDEYARFKLLEAKLRASGRDAEVHTLLGQLSEVDEIALQILKEINLYRDSSPEAAQLYNVTGTKDKSKQADWLAERIVAKRAAEEIVSRYTPSADVVGAMFYETDKRATERRKDKFATRPGKGAYDAYVAERRSGAEAVASAVSDGFKRLIGAGSGGRGGGAAAPLGGSSA